MIKFLQHLFQNTLFKFHKSRLLGNHLQSKNLDPAAVMELAAGGSKIKNKSDLIMEVPAKKLKVVHAANVLQRTVATMCGTWRGDEVDGGLVLVFKTRDPGLSPDPQREADYPENIEDFWVQPPADSDDSQISKNGRGHIALGRGTQVPTLCSGFPVCGGKGHLYYKIPFNGFKILVDVVVCIWLFSLRRLSSYEAVHERQCFVSRPSIRQALSSAALNQQGTL